MLYRQHCSYTYYSCGQYCSVVETMWAATWRKSIVLWYENTQLSQQYTHINTCAEVGGRYSFVIQEKRGQIMRCKVRSEFCYVRKMLKLRK